MMEHTPLDSSIHPSVSAPLTREQLKDMQNLGIEVHGDFSPLLDALNTSKGTAMAPRPEGYHMTVISPQESPVLAQLSEVQIQQLQAINEQIQKGEGVVITGVGYIDGSTNPRAREADKTKKTSFLAVDAPEVQNFRKSVGLPYKDFHVTLGYENGDIHMQVIGKDEKGKERLAPIPKKADPALDGIRQLITAMTFGSLKGPPRPTKKA